LFAVEIERLIEQMNAGQVPSGELLAIAFQIEESAVELSYSTIAKTDDSVFNMLAKRVDNQSAEHKSKIAARLSATR
jgi:hypothetical protein